MFFGESAFKETIDGVIKRIISFSEKARREGLLSLEGELDKTVLQFRQNLFEYGMRFVIDGTDTKLIKKILRNIKKHKTPQESQKVIDNLCIAGVLGIQRGDNPQILLVLLDSIVPENARSNWLKEEVNKINGVS